MTSHNSPSTEMERLQPTIPVQCWFFKTYFFAALSGEPAGILYLTENFTVTYRLYYLNYSAFVSQPQSLNISEGDNATFSCSDTPENIDISWKIDGTNLHQHNHRHSTPHPAETLAGGVTLTVPGLAINDNIAIQCRLLPFLQPSLKSDLASLGVQGDF